MWMRIRRKLQAHRGAVVLTWLTAGGLAVFTLVWIRRFDHGDAWVRAEPFAAAALALFLAAVIYEICNPAPQMEPADVPAGVTELTPFITRAEAMLQRGRADHTEVGGNLATLLGFVATGGGIIAVTSTTKLAVTPLVECAIGAALCVLVLCLLGLRPEHHAQTTDTAQRFETWAAEQSAIDRSYLQYLAHACDRYERFRRVRRAYYIYAGWVFVLVIATIGLDVVFSDCRFPHTATAAACSPSTVKR